MGRLQDVLFFDSGVHAQTCTPGSFYLPRIVREMNACIHFRATQAAKVKPFMSHPSGNSAKKRAGTFLWMCYNYRIMVEQQEAAIDLSTILKSSHENKWVAIAPDYSKVIAAADTLRDLMRSVNNKDAVYHRVLSRDVNFVPAA